MLKSPQILIFKICGDFYYFHRDDCVQLCILILRVMACFFHELVMLLLYMQQEMIRLPGGY